MPTQEEIELETLKANSPYALPDDTAASGWTTAQVKEKFYAGLLYLYEIVKSFRNATNGEVSDLSDHVDELETTLTEYIAQYRAEKDDEGNVIKATYAKIAKIADGTVAALKYIKANADTEEINAIEPRLMLLINELYSFFSNGKAKVALLSEKATADANGRVIASSYALKSEVASVSQSVQNILTGVSSAYKAVCDGNGNAIVNTYETKTDSATHCATAKSEAISSAATTAQGKVDALAAAMNFSNGAFSKIVAALLQVTKMEVVETETKSATLEDQFLEMLAGNTVAYGTNYVGFVFAKYDATNDFFVGIYNDTLMIGDCTATRDANGKITGITPISLEPLATRAASSALTDGHLLAWDGTNLRIIDGNYTIAQIGAVLTQESGRVLAEEGRVSAETTRQSNETARYEALKELLRTRPAMITKAQYDHIHDDGYYCNWTFTPASESGGVTTPAKWEMSVDETADASADFSFPYQSDAHYDVSDQYDMSDIEADIAALEASQDLKQDKINGLTDGNGSLAYTGEVTVKTIKQTQANHSFEGSYSAPLGGTIAAGYTRGQVINNVMYLIGNYTLTCDTAGSFTGFGHLTMTLPAAQAGAVYDFNGDTVADPVNSEEIVASGTCVAALSNAGGQGASNYVDCYFEIANATTANVLKVYVYPKSALTMAANDEVSVMFRVPLTLI